MDKDVARYPMGTALEMARIPREARERFLAELPAVLDQLPDIEAALPAMIEEARAKLPAFMRWLFSEKAAEASFRRQLTTNLVWVDDDNGTGTVSVRLARGLEPLVSRTVSLREHQS